jgi:hypothetical protein
LTIWRIGRSRRLFGTKPSRRCSVKGFSVKVSAPYMGFGPVSDYKKGWLQIIG